MVDGIAVAAHESKICVNDPLCPSVLASLVCLHFDMTYREERPSLLVLDNTSCKLFKHFIYQKNDITENYFFCSSSNNK